MIEKAGKIMDRVFRFLPAHLKLQNVVITQQDCLSYLQNDDANKLVLLDVPYIGSERTCAVTGYKYQPFHQKVTDCLQNAKYPFLYYIGSENTCSVAGYKYQPFHKKVADYLQNAEYPFLYYCRSTPPKSDNIFNKADAEHIMKIKLGQYFMNKGYYFQKVRLDNDTELMISNYQYDTKIQFQWADMDENII